MSSGGVAAVQSNSVNPNVLLMRLMIATPSCRIDLSIDMIKELIGTLGQIQRSLRSSVANAEMLGDVINLGQVLKPIRALVANQPGIAPLLFLILKQAPAEFHPPAARVAPPLSTSALLEHLRDVPGDYLKRLDLESYPTNELMILLHCEEEDSCSSRLADLTREQCLYLQHLDVSDSEGGESLKAALMRHGFMHVDDAI